MPDYDRGIRLMVDVMDVEESGVLDCFVEAGAELQRTQVAPEADAYMFVKVDRHGVFDGGQCGTVARSRRALRTGENDSAVSCRVDQMC